MLGLMLVTAVTRLGPDILLSGGQSYIIPAAVIMLNFLVLWRLVPLTGFSIKRRRRWFIVSGVVLFCPILKGDIDIVVIPSAFYFLDNWAAYGPLYASLVYVAYLPMIAIPATITAVLFACVGRWVVGTPPEGLRWRWRDGVFPIVVMAGTFVLLRATLPVYGITPDVTESRMEDMYGGSLKAVAALTRISDSKEREAEARKLKTTFRDDPVLISITASRDHEYFAFEQREALDSLLCPDSLAPVQPRLARCVWTNGHAHDLTMIRYDREYSHDLPSPVDITVYLDYAQLRPRL